MNSETNPANEPTKRVVDDTTRVPMSLPNLMLQVPEIDGYVMHWFADRPGRIGRAMKAGYEFVGPDEVELTNFDLASDVANSGNTDMGTRVSVHGGTAEGGKPERLYLMKIKKEWYDKDMALREEATDKVVKALRGGTVGADRESMANAAQRYAKNTDNLFTKKRRS